MATIQDKIAAERRKRQEQTWDAIALIKNDPGSSALREMFQCLVRLGALSREIGVFIPVPHVTALIHVKWDQDVAFSIVEPGKPGESSFTSWKNEDVAAFIVNFEYNMYTHGAIGGRLHQLPASSL